MLVISPFYLTCFCTHGHRRPLTHKEWFSASAKLCVTFNTSYCNDILITDSILTQENSPGSTSQPRTYWAQVPSSFSVIGFMHTYLFLPNPVKNILSTQALILRGNISCWLYGFGTKSLSDVLWSTRLTWWLRRCYARSSLHLLAFFCVSGNGDNRVR